MSAIAPAPVVSTLIASALAPVFLIAGIAGILNVISLRLSRAIDRGRDLIEGDTPDAVEVVQELEIIDRRIARANWATTFCVASALCVCLVVILIFVTPIWKVNFGNAAGLIFIVAMLLLGAGLVAFLAEVRAAVQVPRFPPRR